MYKKQYLLDNFTIFLTVVITLIAIGSIAIYSASSIYALELHGDPHYFIKRHMVGITVGCLGFLVLQIIPFTFIKYMAPLALTIALLLTAATLIPSLGYRVHGSSRWLSLGNITFQPSELLKIALLLFWGFFLDKKKKFAHEPFLYHMLPLVVLSLIAIILLKQPDFGSLITLLITTLTIFFIAVLPKIYLLALLSGSAILSSILIVIRPYRLQRILTFINPWKDPKGSGFQIIQSLIAVGSGGWLGAGIAHSKQKFFYVPMQHTDFIFSIIAEETGFIGCLFLLLLYILFLYFGMRIAWYVDDLCATFFILGFVILTSVQAFLNMAVATGLVPTKGIGLPFVSYGNTALVCNITAVGIIANIIYQRGKPWNNKPFLQ